MTERPSGELIATIKIDPYRLPRKRLPLGLKNQENAYGGKERRMAVRCRECNRLFDSTFTIEDIANLPREGLESGTMHLCPYCGHLGLYLLKDYVEETK